MREKNFLPVAVILVGLILSFIFWKFIFEPTRSEILKMQTETKKLQAAAQELESLQLRHENFSDFVELNGERLKNLRLLLPSNSSQEKFTAEIYRAANENKISVTSLQVGELTEAEGENLRRQSVRIKLTGNYISILNFVREIQDGERFAKLENISMEIDASNLISGDAEFFIFNSE